MRKVLLAVMICMICIVSVGCSAFVRTNILDSESPSLEDSTDFKANSSIECWVMRKTDSSLLLVTGDSQMFLVSADGIPVTDKAGSSIGFNEVIVSDTVEITYDGGIIETYPAMFSGISSIRVTGRQSTFVPLYCDVIDALYEQASELNGNTGMFAFDLTELTNLSDAEKNALIYIAGDKYTKESFFATYDDLKDHDYLNDKADSFTDGLLITISVSEVSRDDGFEFSASKWKGVGQEVGFSECLAKKNGSEWTYEIGAVWTAKKPK